MDSVDYSAEGTQPVGEELNCQLLEPFIEATTVALGEMANIDAAVQTRYRKTLRTALGEINAVIGLNSAVAGTLVLGFPKPTAAALAGRMLADAAVQMDDSLIRDCVGEIGNVVAGQAKALLAGTPCRFAFSVPEVSEGAGAFCPAEGLDCLVVSFSSSQGGFALQLFLKAALDRG